MESRNVKWEEIREKERELYTLEERYYQEKKKLDNKALDLDERNANLEKLMDEESDKLYQVLRKFSSTADCVREYFTELESLRYHSNRVYRTNGIKLEEEKEKLDKEFRQRKNILDEEYHKLRRNYASTNR